MVYITADKALILNKFAPDLMCKITKLISFFRNCKKKVDFTEPLIYNAFVILHSWRNYL